MKFLKAGISFMLLLTCIGAYAQTIEEGKKFLYYERYQSAKNVFKKLADANPQNVEAVYYLGQSIILRDDCTQKEFSEVKSLYQKQLQANNHPLLIAGIGHIELLEGNASEARRLFELAANLTEKKNLLVLNAIGFANSNPDTKNGDASYAITILQHARTLKKFNDPDVLVNLGDAYRKLGDGGNAIIAYEAATAINPTYARAPYRIGKLYQTQGSGQESLYLEYFNKSISIDPAYAPVYATLFNYYYETDIKRAAEFFSKWQSNSDTDSKSCYYKAALIYAQSNFRETISEAADCIANEGPDAYPSLYVLSASAYNKLNDSLNALKYYEIYFSKQDVNKIRPLDYLDYVRNIIKIGGKDSACMNFINLALMSEPVESNKIKMLTTIAQDFEAKKNYNESVKYYSKIISLKSTPSRNDYYNVASTFNRVGKFDSAFFYYNEYTKKFPEDIYGHFNAGKTARYIDTTFKIGLANPYFQKTIELGILDSAKNKQQLIAAYKYFATEAAVLKQDPVVALDFVDKILALDPNDAEAQRNKSILMQAQQAPKKKPTSGRP